MLKATGKLEKEDALLICTSSKGVLAKQTSGHAHFTPSTEAARFGNGLLQLPVTEIFAQIYHLPPSAFLQMN